MQNLLNFFIVFTIYNFHQYSITKLQLQVLYCIFVHFLFIFIFAERAFRIIQVVPSPAPGTLALCNRVWSFGVFQLEQFDFTAVWTCIDCGFQRACEQIRPIAQKPACLPKLKFRVHDVAHGRSTPQTLYRFHRHSPSFIYG